MNDLDKQERKKEKKIQRLLKKSAYAVGLGIGLLLLKFVVVPFLGESEQTEKALGLFSYCLILYGASIIVTFIVKKDWLIKVDLLLSWVIMPLILVKLLTDAL